MKFGYSVSIPAEGGGEKTIATDELRLEVTKWFNKCRDLDKKMQDVKANMHSPLHQLLEQHKGWLQQKDTLIANLSSKQAQLESEVHRQTALANEWQSKYKEVNDVKTKLQKENLPKLDTMDKLLSKSCEAVDVLTADAELLSSMFRTQVLENKKNIDDRDAIQKDLNKLQKMLKSERQNNKFKEDELQKKETLYLRTMAARKSMHEAYLEQKARITEIEQQMKQREVEWQEMLSVIEGRDNEIQKLKEDLRRANHRIDEIEQQKKMCMTEFKKRTGQTFDALLHQFKATPTSPDEPMS